MFAVDTAVGDNSRVSGDLDGDNRKKPMGKSEEKMGLVMRHGPMT